MRQKRTAQQSLFDPEPVHHPAVLKHLRQETWRGLEFALSDWASARRFVRADPARLPKKSALQATVGAVRPDRWEQVNRDLLRAARDCGVETGARMRVDSTVTETHILAPADSRLLYDGVRVLTRLLEEAGDNPVPTRSRPMITAESPSGIIWKRVRNAGGIADSDLPPRVTARGAHSAMSMGRCPPWRRQLHGRTAGRVMCATTPTSYAA